VTGALLAGSARDEELRRAQRVEIGAGTLAHARRLRWSKPQIASERQNRLRELVAHAVAHSPYHAERLAGVDPSRVTEEQLSTFPVMTKDDLMSEFDWIVTDPRLSLAVVEDHMAHAEDRQYLYDRFRVVTSSGSSGRRGIYVYDWDEWVTLALMQSRARLGMVDDSPRPPGRSTASLYAGAGAHLSRVMRSFLAAPGDDIHHFPMTLPVAEVVRGLNVLQPELLMGYPSAVDVIVKEAEGGRLTICPRYVETCGELLMERTRRAVEALWGVEIDDSWAVVEGAHAFACSAGQALHLPDDLVIVEPVDLDGRPVAPGEPAAKLYLTNLYNRTEPLIRFEIADGLTVLDDVCTCGCAHRRVTDLTGRADVVFDYGNDVRVHPMLLRLELHDVSEYQVRQTARGAIVKIVSHRPQELGPIRARVARSLQMAGVRDPEVVVEPVDRLERLPSGKLRQFIGRLGG
jgi:phenylacetate-CoA ligase